MGDIFNEDEHSLPEVAADFNHWSKMPYWSLEESVALLLGQDPEVVNWEIAQHHQEWPFATELSLNYAKLRGLLLRAFEKQEINEHNSPAVFLTWAESRDVEIPEGLIQQVAVIKNKQASINAELEDKLKIKEEEIAALKKRIEELESLVWPGFDESQSTYSKELEIAVKAYDAVRQSWKKGMSIKQQIMLWLEANYPALMNEEKERIAKICNWQKGGGAPCTP